MHSDPSTTYAPPRTEALAAKHEVEDLTLGGIKGFVFFLVITLLFTFVVVWAVDRALLHMSVAEDDTPSPFAGVHHPLPPDPQIQPSRYHNTLDTEDLNAFRKEESAKLEEYAWVGAEKQKLRIPITRAMDLALQQDAFPTRTAAAGNSPAALPVSGGVGGLMVAPSNPLTLPPGTQTPGSHD